MSSRGEQRREARDAGGSEMKKFYWVLAIVAVIGIAAVGYSLGSNAFGTAVSTPVEVEGLDDMERLVELAQGVTRGDPEAPLTIIEFADYQCPSCGQFALSVKPQVDLTYIETGQAKFVLYDFPLTQMHPHAFLAARAARCAGDQDRYWQYHDVLFRNQPSWAAQSQVVGTLVGYAEGAGLDQEAFESCLKSDRHAEVVTANMRLGTELGVSGTPTVIINQGGRMQRLGSTDFASIRSVIESLRSGTEGSGN